MYVTYSISVSLSFFSPTFCLATRKLKVVQLKRWRRCEEGLFNFFSHGFKSRDENGAFCVLPMLIGQGPLVINPLSLNLLSLLPLDLNSADLFPLDLIKASLFCCPVQPDMQQSEEH